MAVSDSARRAKFKEAEERVWEKFRPKLEAVTCSAEAMLLFADAPPPDSPGRLFYTKLGLFLNGFLISSDLSEEEKLLYIRLVQRMVAAKEVKPEVAKLVVESLQRRSTHG